MRLQNRRVKRGWMNLRVNKIVQETHDTKTFFLVDNEEGSYQFDYTAGQYLTFRFDSIAKKPVVRSYTISSSPCQKESVAITVKKISPGFISDYFYLEVKEGDVLRARGPIGKFVFDYACDCRDLVMIAGGSGITPFISIARQYATTLGEIDAPQKLTIVVSYKTKKDLIFFEELTDLNKNKNIEVFVFLTRDQSDSKGMFSGRIDEERFSKIMNFSYQNKTYMACGPEPLIAKMISFLRKAQVSEKSIKTESFVN